MNGRNVGDVVPGVPPHSVRRRAETSATRAAYVIADARGCCVDATDPALELLGTDLETLRMLRVGDLSKPDTPDSLTRQLIASCDTVGAWLTGMCQLLRADGEAVAVRFGTLRLKSGELVTRFEPLPASTGESDGPREVLEAWRRQELALSWTAPGTTEHRLAELEALWLAAEYQRLAIARAESMGAEL